MVKFELLKKKDSTAYFHVKDARVQLVNAVRKTIISSMPYFAIEEVNFYENSSPLFNEYIAHRLALIPLTSDDHASPEAKISFSLEASGPGVVYSKDLKSTDDKITVAALHIPIVTLMENQNLRLEATAARGTASQHAKFQNAHCSYSYYPQLKAKGKELKEAMELLPRGSVDEDGKITAPEKIDIGPINQNINIGYKEGEFVMLVESYNGEDPEKVLKHAVKILKENSEEFKKELKE